MPSSPLARRPVDKRLTFVWKGPFENWSRSYVIRHFWRVRAILGSEEDALQECAYLFALCVNRYAERVNNPAWMMSLFKTIVANHWHQLAEADGKQRRARDPDQLAQHAELLPRAEPNLGPLLAGWHAASEELKVALRVIAEAPAELLDMMFSDRSRERTNRRIRRLCGIKGHADLVGELRALLS